MMKILATMSQASSVDIVIPAFNAAGTIQETLDSLLGQEGIGGIFVVDDGSTDGTSDIVRRYQKNDVSLLVGSNQGVSEARNLGAALGSSDWIIFLDADDLLVDGTVARRLEVVERTGVEILFSDWVDFFGESSAALAEGRRRFVDLAKLKQDQELAMATSAVWAPPAAIMSRRCLFEKVGGFRADLSIIQDARYLFDSARAGACFGHSGNVEAKYRVLADSLSRSDPARFWRDVLLNGKQIEALWREDGTLTPQRAAGVRSIYDVAGRGLLAERDPKFFEAVDALGHLAAGSSRFMKIATAIAKVGGLGPARYVLSSLGRL